MNGKKILHRGRGRTKRASASKILKRAAVTGAICVLGLLAIAAGGMAALLYTEFGGRWALEQVVHRYNDAIPGRLSIERISGILSSNVTLEDIKLMDTDEDVLIAAKTVQLHWSPFGLLDKKIQDATLTIQKAVVNLHDKGDRNPFTDLAPSVSAQETPDSEGLGPDLPLNITGTLRIDDFELNQVTNDKREALITGVTLDGAFQGLGRKAEVTVSKASGTFPSYGLTVDTLAFSAGWRDPRVTLNDFVLKTNWGNATIDELALDAETLTGTARMEAVIREDFLNQKLPTWIGGNAQVALAMKGEPNALFVTASVKGQKTAKALVVVEGSAWPTIDLSTSIDISQLKPGVVTGLETVVSAGSGRFSIKGNRFETAHIKGNFQCEKCRLGAIGEVDAEAGVDLADGTGTLQAAMAGAGIDIHAKVELARQQLKKIDWRATALDLAKTTKAFQRAADIPKLSGSIDVSGSCRSEEERLQCTGTAKGDRVGSPWGACQRLGGTFRIAPEAPRLPFETELTFAKTRIGKEHIGRISIGARGDMDRIEGNITGHRKGTRRLQATVALDTRLPLKVALKTLYAEYKTLNIRLRSPQTIEIRDTYISIPDIALNVAGGELLFGGTLNPEGESNLKFDIHNIDTENLSLLFPNHPVKGVVNGGGKVLGTLKNLRAEVNLKADNLEYEALRIGNTHIEATYHLGRLRGTLKIREGLAEDLFATASVALNIDGEAGSAQIVETGEHDIRIQAERVNLGILTSLTGQEFSGRVNVDGRFQKIGGVPRFYLRANADELAWQTLRLKGTTCDLLSENDEIHVDIRSSGPLFSSLTLQGSIPATVDWNGAPTWRREHFHSLELRAEAVRVEPLISLISSTFPKWETKRWPSAEQLTVQAGLHGSLVRPKIDAYLDIKNTQFEGRPMGNVVIGVHADNGETSVHAQVTQGDNRYADVKAKVPISVNLLNPAWSWEPDKHHTLSVRFQGVDSALFKPFVAMPEGIDFRIKGEMSGSGRFGAFSLQGTWQGTLAVLGFPSAFINLRLAANQNVQELYAYTGPKDRPVAALAARTHLPESLLDEKTRNLRQIPIDIKLKMPSLSLRRYGSMLPRSLHDIKGRLNGEVAVKGTIGAPLFSGKLQLKGGEVTIAPLNQRIKEIGFTASVSGRTLNANNVQFKSGQGLGKGNLAINYLGDGRVKSTGLFKIKNFPVVKPGIPVGLISATIGAHVEHDDNVTQLAFDLSDAQIRLISKASTRTPKEIPRSSRIKVRRTDRHPSKHRAVKRQDSKTAEPSPKLKLAVSLKDPMEIRGDGVDMRWRGDLSVTTEGKKNAVEGGIQALPGRFLLLGNTFQIETGEVVFDKQGDLDPFVNITAHTRTSEADVTAVIRGRISHPDLILRSEPPLTQYQIVALLITGKSDTSDREGTGNVPAQAASLLMSFSNPALERQIYDKLGIDRASVGVGKTVEEPIVTVGKRVSKKVYIETEYHHNAPAGENTASGRVEYRLTPDWSLETSFGDAQKGDVGVFWQKRFDSKDNKERKAPAKKQPEKNAR